ncbi:Uncharacterized protein PHSC3_001236 [Chlamydiales bacterium STE3]|nr:Uncharacterized protein PHSC3_001236 [Chlamydiales bacterium STE3]
MDLTDDYDSFSLGDAMDNAVLMHRDAHFGGNFALMIDYYQNEGKGVYDDFSLNRIEELAAYEKAIQQNLASQLLTAPEIEKIVLAKEAYQQLSKLYDGKDDKVTYPRLIADLILSEEENPVQEIEAIVQEKKAIVPALLNLVRAEDFYDPLFPGYGKAPLLAAKCLGLIGDSSAIIALFESIGKGDFFDDDIALNALKEIGEPAKHFLLKVLQGKPINEDNERAAIALLTFKADPEIASTCFHLLRSLDLKKEIPLATYLILGCEGLEDEKERQQFEQLAHDPQFPKELQADLKSIIQEWKHKEKTNS